MLFKKKAWEASARFLLHLRQDYEGLVEFGQAEKRTAFQAEGTPQTKAGKLT